ncbi:MAG: PAS domain S-box protein [Terriglobia bacterium]|jgi:PAS domain S-box-containing protein
MMDTTEPDGVNSSTPSLRVLILEDNPRDAKLNVSVLEGGGFRVQFEVTDSAQFFRERLEKAEYDVILADFNLRNWTALDALEILKQSGKDIPLIMVTGFLGDEAAVECIKQGAADFVLKDRPARLSNAVRRALEEKRLRTENKRAFDAISRLATIVESSDDAIIGGTLEGVITSWNKGAEKLYGYSAGEILGQPISVLAPPERSEEVTQILARLKRGERIEEYELERVRKDGSLIYISLSLFRLTGSRGEVTGAAAIARDVTERKRAEQALHESEERYRSLVEAAPDVIFTVSAEDGSLTSLNPAFETLTGWSRAEWLGRPFVGMVHPDDLPVAVERFQKALRGETHPPHELRVLCKSGEYLVGEFTSTSHVKDGKVVGQLGIARDITDRKRADEALRESEELYRSVVTSVAEGIMLVDRGGAIVACNRSAERILGLTTEELIGRTAADPRWQAIHEDGSPLPGENFPGMAALRTGKPQSNLYMGVHKPNGSLAWTIANSVPIFHAGDGAPYVVVTSFADITERKRAEEALIEERYLLHTLMDNLPDAIYFKDRESRFTRTNKAHAKQFGLSHHAQAVGKTDFDFFTAEHAQPAYNDEQEIIRTGQPVVNKEERETWPDGRVTWVSTTKMPLRDAHGNIIGTFGVSRDITQHKQAEAEHARLVTAIEQSAEAVVITNTTGGIEYVNPAFTRITGYGREEVLGQNPRILKSDKQDPEFYQQLWATILNGQIWHGELINRRKDGSLYTEEMNIAPVRNQVGEITHFIATKQDVTEHKQLEQQLIQAQKMEAVGRLAGGVAHDFNNLLTIINGYAQLLIEPISPQDPRRGHLKEILMAGERAASLTRQLLAFSRRQVLEPRVLNLNSVLADVAKMLRRLIGEDVELVSTLKPDLGRVKVDPGQIEQVIMNLAVNARDAMPQGGKLFIETSNVEIDANYARRHSPMMPGKYVMVAVSDTGCGMDLETQAHAFEPFFTTKEKGHGTGLGLATVYGIVKQSGGFIWVYSAPGHGSTFKIYLPFIEEALPTAEPAEAPAELAKGSETVLVVEDERGVRSLVCEALASHGYKVLEAAGAASALEISERYTEPIHLLLTDVVMPQTGGKELAKGFSTLHPETKVLYMSGYTDDAIVRHGILEGGTSFLQKPFQPKALLLKIREVLKMKSGTQQF